MGSRVLEHRGRSSGKVFHTPVNLLTIDGTEYLVSPRGETQWVRNVRHAGGHLVLILGRRRRPYTATEVPVADSVPILRAYLRRWKFEVGMFFDGVSPDSTDEEWAAVAARHPVFVAELTTRRPTGGRVPRDGRGGTASWWRMTDSRSQAALGHRNLIAFNRAATHWGSRGALEEGGGAVLCAGGTWIPVVANGAYRIDHTLDGGELIARADEFFGSLARGFTIKVRDTGEDDDLRQACEAAGLERFGTPVPQMILDGPLREPATDDGIATAPGGRRGGRPPTSSPSTPRRTGPTACRRRCSPTCSTSRSDCWRTPARTSWWPPAPASPSPRP